MSMGRTLVVTIRYLSGSEVAARLGLHVKTFNRYLREGRLDAFPQPRRLADGVRRWVEAEVEQWQLTRPVEPGYTKAPLSCPPELMAPNGGTGLVGMRLEEASGSPR